MKRKLLTQMRREWTGNVWMVVELAIISVIIWFACTMIYMLVMLYGPDKHYDISKDYIMAVKDIPDSDPDREITSDEYMAEYKLLMSKLRNMPQVKAAGGTTNGIPYNYNYWGDVMMDIIDGDTILYRGNQRFYDAEALKIMGLTGTRGETPEQIAAELEAGNVVLSNIEYEDYLFEDGEEKPADNGEKLRGRLLTNTYDESRTAQASMIVVRPIRRADYEPSNGRGVFIKPMKRVPDELLIRLHDGMENDFKTAVNRDPLMSEHLAFSDLTSVAERRQKANTQFDIEKLNAVMQSGFFLLLAFLGILGTYWFRVQERVPEIAVRKVNGATNGDILRRLFGESLILLAIATVLSVGAGWLLLDKELVPDTLLQMPKTWLYTSMGLTTAAMAVIVLAGIYIPARKAMKIDPARALKEQ